MSTRVVYVVGCGAAKLDRPARARALYTGGLFVAARQYVEALGAEWRVLSGYYGLVHPNRVLKPYNQRLPRQQRERDAWALIAATGLTYENAGSPWRAVFLCGAEYADPVATELATRGIVTEQPLAGLGMGARLRWLRAARDVAQRSGQGAAT